ncbi:TOTE conflict system archaeo-eukaryotic primase domain-containing protein [Bacteroides sp. 224]|uniref:TOTE conflict system archaeo-eukaryotic primase domain-containing protein n=1 Tax=Bacteroides sp. 224 TaxID=2302936 RepID=UPI0013D33AD5|nr:DEAD/DEAH box helicase family protein [Bacteroides sp. 224]NDV65297.1 helicase [Bacteroides sp. 224]
MSESELLKQIAELKTQNLKLLAENERLREMLNLPQKNTEKTTLLSNILKQINTEKPSATSINKYSTPEEKIDLFQSLFQGRTDVYAKRCYSKKHRSSYYIPACKNEWVKGICDRTRVKCKDCTNRDLLPLTTEVIDSHLRNKDEHGAGIVGIYPLLQNENCVFLAVDFDKEKWKEDITTFRSICNTYNIPVAIERSRSGNGAHAWIFFALPIPAVSARRLGNALLTKAMTVRHEISFTSYDRMFPNQDFMPKGGFGNLIALPLQGGARENGNSEFIDENFKSYSDQWSYLASVKKMNLTEIEVLLPLLCEGSSLGELGRIEDNEGNLFKPWENGNPDNIEKKDFPEILTIVEANLIYIPKERISARALNRIKRLAAFQNPLFYKTQKMRMSTYGIPRIIYSLNETDEYIGIPRGCRSSLVHLLESSNVQYVFDDKRNKGKQINVHFKGTFREEQQFAADALLQCENGILSVPTAFGKTVIGASLIAERKCNTLILVHLQTLCDQWKRSLEQFLEINESLPEPEKKRGRKKARPIIGQICSGKKTSSGIIDIALVQSLVRENEVNELVKNYGIVIVDECHHASSLSYEKVLSEINARYVYGLTATPKRQDGQHPATFMQCGPIRYSISAKEQADKRNFEHYIVPCFTRFRKPLNQNESDWHITKVYAALAENEPRNQQIAADVKEAITNGRTPIILAQRKEHVNRLAAILGSQTSAQIITLIGANSTKIRNKMVESLAAISDDEKLIVIATGKYIGEGFDYPRLDTLFLASPIAWKGTLAQYAGRLHRDYPEKQYVIVYDYVDIHIPVLERMYHKRLTGYAQIGYKTLSSKNEPDKINMIYDCDTFVSVIRNDFAKAEKEIRIVSPYIRRKQLNVVFEWLKVPLQIGIPITVTIRPVESYKEQEQIRECIEVLQARLTVVQESDIYQKYIIIDDRIVWYGNISLFDPGNSEDTIMRLDSKELANELS